MLFRSCLSELQQAGYIEAGIIKNPVTTDKMTGSIRVRYIAETKTYEYTYQESDSCSFFLPEIIVIDKEEKYTFAYTGSVKTFTVPETGKYKIEAWGAAGGINLNPELVGKGGYTSGIITLTKGEKLYLRVGGTTTVEAGGYNGGGDGSRSYNGASATGVGGGGASDIRLDDSLNSRIMVAAGGGGTTNWRSSASTVMFAGCCRDLNACLL